MIKRFLFWCFLFLVKTSLTAQCGLTAVSTNGWTVNVVYNVTSIAVYPNGSPCGSYYKFAPVVSYSITFTGSNTSRSVTLQNMCINCLNQNQATTCQDCNNNVGTFTGNTTGTVVVNNNNCEYDASYDGAGHPYYPAPKVDCSQMNLSYAQCTSGKVDVFGNGISYTSGVPCAGINPLPIELINFKGSFAKDEVYLKWSTLTETNNDFFTVEKSADGINFEEIARIKGAGTTKQQSDYSLVDGKPYGGFSYYVLKQTDYNGKSKSFPMIAVENKNIQVQVSNIHPNPTTGTLGFTIYSPEKGTMRMQLIDNMGRCVLDKTEILEETQSQITLETTNIISGIYMLKVSLPETGFSTISKIIKN